MKVKLSDVCDIIKGKTTITKAVEGEYPLVVTGENRLSNNEFQFDCSAVCVPLVSATGHGHASIKRIHYQEGKFALGSILAAVIPKSTDEVNTRYLHIYLSYFKDSVLVPLMRGSANVSLTIKALGSAEIELPPIDRQLDIVRLVSKVEEMKSEIDKYLIDQENTISNMKKEILQLAVQGKLVEQDPKDEPADVLLWKIREEKERLIKEKKIKKEKPLADITSEDVLYDLPNTWSWVRLGEILSILTDYHANGGYETLKKNVKLLDQPDYAIMVRISNLGDNQKAEYKYITKEAYEFLSKSKLFENDIVMSKITDPGTVYYVPNFDKPMSLAMNLFLLRIDKNINSMYIYRYLYIMKSYIKQFEGGTATKTITKDAVKNLLVAIPPALEQKRILEKVDSLMALCDELEKKIQKQRGYSNRLMESILKSSF